MNILIFIKIQIEKLVYLCFNIIIISISDLPIKTVSIRSFITKMIMCLMVPNLFYVIILSRKEKFKSVLDLFIRYSKKLKRRLNIG